MINKYAKLRGKIVEKFRTQNNFSKAMGLSVRTISLKLNGKRSWKQCEINTMLKLLDLEKSEIPTYFF